MPYILERDWITEAGLRALCIILTREDSTKRHRCGYVAVDKSHPAYGKGYSEQLDCISQEVVDSAKIGDKSPLLIFSAMVGSDNEHNIIRRSMDILIDCHGGLTYSGECPVNELNSSDWWFGFDCAHCDDAPIERVGYDYGFQNSTVKDLAFVEAQCEKIAAQLKEIGDTTK